MNISRFTTQILLFSFLPFAVFAQQYFDQSANLGISGNYGTHSAPPGGGLSFVDFNGDGLDDLTFATEAGQELMFYENMGDHFSLVSPAFVSNTEEQTQVIWVDFDNDGDKDLFVVSSVGPNHMYENDGAMNFTEVTASLGLPVVDFHSGGATFGDIDQDGYLDLYVCQYDIANQGAENEMWKWDPSTNTYIDYTLTSGTGNGARLSFYSTFFDMDNDGDLDMYVVNDSGTQENSMYMNIGGGTFIDVSVPSLSNISIDAMNAAICDYDNDLDFDIYITDTNVAQLLQNNGNSTFTDVAVSAGVAESDWAWTGNFLDYDNDRDHDLYVSTYTPVNTVNGMYVNDGTGNFTEPLAATHGLTGNDTVSSYAHAVGDFNRDGLLDIALNNALSENFRLYVNQEISTNNFIQLDLEGTSSNKDAYGAFIELVIGGQTSIYHTHCIEGFNGQNSDIFHLGLGTETSIDQIVIHWPYPNSTTTLLNSDIVLNNIHHVIEGTGVVNTYTTDLCLTTHNVVLDPIPSQVYGASLDLNSSKAVQQNASVHFDAEVEINLTNGFSVPAGSVFEGEIKLCNN